MKYLAITLLVAVCLIAVSAVFSKSGRAEAYGYSDPTMKTNIIVNRAYNEGEYSELLDLYNKQMANVEAEVKSPTPFYNRALIKQKLKDFDGAEKDFNKAIELAKVSGFMPAEDVLYIAKAQMFFDKKDYTKAIETYNEALSIANNDFYSCPTLVSLGEMYRYLGEYDKANEYYAKALKENQYYEPAYHSRGYTKILQENYKGAVEDLTAALEIAQNPYSYAHRGFAYIQLNELKKAEKDLKQALKLMPDSKVALYYMAYYYKKQNNQSKANSYISKADQVALVPEIYANTLGGMVSNMEVFILEAWLASRIEGADVYAAKYAKGEITE